MKEKRVNLMRHKITFSLLRPIFIIYNRIVYGYTFRKFNTQKDKGYLILSNHNCNLDPFFISSSFKMPIYFVASDHIFRLGFLSKIIEYLVAPIPIVKSNIDLTAIKRIKNSISQGGTVCLFPSGNKSFNGISVEIEPSIAKLIKAIKAPILLYKLDGLYFSSPRWAKTHRVGKSFGEVVRELSVDEIKKLSLEEIYEIVIESLYEDAYEVQKTKMIKYKGKRLAEGLERVLYLCPSCEKLGHIKGIDNKFICGCGYSVEYDQYGFLKAIGDEELYFSTITQWDLWQKDKLQERILNQDIDHSEVLFTDKEMSLYKCKKNEYNELIFSGDVYGYKDRFEISYEDKKIEFNFKDIINLTCIASQILQFSLRSGETYEIKSKNLFSVVKYMHISEAYTSGGKRYEHAVK